MKKSLRAFDATVADSNAQVRRAQRIRYNGTSSDLLEGYARPLNIRLSHHVKIAKPKLQATSTTQEAEQASVPVSLSLVAFRDDIHFAFLFDNFVWSSYGSPWLQFAAQGRLGHISRQACQALSQTTFGKHYYLRDTELTGATQYGLAVGGLRTALTPRQERATPDAALLVPILIFLIHASTAGSLTESTSHVTVRR